MGSWLSTDDKPLDQTALVSAAGSKRQKFLKDLVNEHAEFDTQDFYSLFGLPRYAEMTEDRMAQMRDAFRPYIRTWHPDKNSPEMKQECEFRTTRLCLAKQVLEDPDLKRRYDIELRKQLNETGRWSSLGWYAAWGYNIVAMTGGISLIIVGGLGSVLTGGASLAVGITGSSFLASGLQGFWRMRSDPDCSTIEFFKDVTVGALQGAAGSACGAGGTVAMHGIAVAARLCGAAGLGAAATTAARVIADTTDLCITEGVFGKEVENNVISAKTKGYIFSWHNGQQYALKAAIGAVVGSAIQGAALAHAGSTGDAGVGDDAPAVGCTACEESATKTLKEATKTVERAVTGGTSVAVPAAVAPTDAVARVAVAAPADAVARVAVAPGAMPTVSVPHVPVFGCAIQCTTSAINGAIEESLFERVQRLSPKLAHKLVNDASQADFMLSRTNLQRDFADDKIVKLLEDGFSLCADHSLSGGWGGRDWVKKYVSNAKKTKFGILVLESGEGFFESAPCCDELYAAKKAGLKLTRMNGISMHSGDYLWANITDDIFDCPLHYERTMRERHGDQWTPIHFKVTLGKFYDKSLSGKKYTYYCTVPRGRVARATGADKQYFAPSD